MIPFTVVCGLVAIGMALVIYGTLVKNRWGINLSSPPCPRCKAAVPKARVPDSFRQALWGGWTCSACGAEIDKWGRQIE